jgi:hypothetical protein
MTSRSYEGGCHCGAVRFRVDADLDAAVVLDCSCSICRKKGFLHLIVQSEHFSLLRGAGALATYTFGTQTARHHFCRTCGVHPFYRPRSHPDAYDVNVRCLDDDVVDRVTIEAFDGRRWDESVAARWATPESET